MHELFRMKVPETLDIKVFMHPITIMTRSPVSISIVRLRTPPSSSIKSLRGKLFPY